MTDVDLLALTSQLVAVPSISHHEDEVATLIEGQLRSCAWLSVDRVGNNVVARTNLGHPRRIMLAGHTDTVPAADNATPRVDGEVLWGLGAADMKGGIAVMLDLATTLAAPSLDVTWCFYACEEVGRADSGLEELWRERPELLAADAAILGEPTACKVEAGCQGTMRAVVALGGIRAHTARPFTGRNAIHRLAPVLTRVATWDGRSSRIDGCEFVEQLQAVAIEGGVAGNVVPDAASVTLNYRYAPDRDMEEAEQFIKGLLDGMVDADFGDSITVTDAADGAMPNLEHPLLASLAAATQTVPVAKVGWTDVASFSAHGIPAANFGPGDPLLAHHPDERVDRTALETSRRVLTSLLTS